MRRKWLHTRSKKIQSRNEFNQEVSKYIQEVSKYSQEVNTIKKEGARGVVVIVVGIGHGDTSSNPGRDWLHFT